MGERRDFYVYCWTNSVNGKQYVGKGRDKRAYDHIRPGRKGRFADAVRKHGRESFVLEFLATGLTDSEAREREKREIAARGTMGTGYNFTIGGDGTAGYRYNDEQREARRIQALERRQSEDTKEKLRQANLGKKHSAESCKKRSEALAARNQDPAWIARCRAGAQAKGSDALKSAKTKGRPKPEEWRQRMRGAKRSEETKAKMRAAWEKRKAAAPVKTPPPALSST